MSPILFISLPFVLLLLMSQGAGASQRPKDKVTKKPSEYQDSDIIIIRRPSRKN